LARFFLRRIAAMMLALFFVVTLTFCLIKAVPGGPFSRDKKLPPAIEKNINEKYHLNDPWFRQYQNYLLNTVKLDFGPSLRYQDRTVNDIILDSFPISFLLGAISLTIALIFGLILGVIAALKKGGFPDYLTMAAASALVSIPSFITGFVLMYLFAYKIRLLPPAMWGSWKHIILPAVSLATLPMAVISRMVRTSLIEVLQEDYIKAARAKGLNMRTVLFRHAIKNALTPVLTYLGPIAAVIFTGSFVIEYIFSVPGLGRYFVYSIQNRDYTMIMGTTVFYSVFLMMINLVVDMLYASIDPRVKLVDKKR